ncbi:hypothetical protein ACSBL2_17465 [Pedobacter sp. AW31-3R]|uniref:hypothetical protein n=1 Tax=Pedobacter sp. AW31-3R TaxID=3445781 RepID=UPI003FA0AC42
MAKSWFHYNKSTPKDKLIASNYSAIPGQPSCCSDNPVNICAVYAGISSTQPIITPNLKSYLKAAAVFPYENQPTGNDVKKYVYTRSQ